MKKPNRERDWTDWYPLALLIMWVIGCVIIGLKNGWT